VQIFSYVEKFRHQKAEDLVDQVIELEFYEKARIAGHLADIEIEEMRYQMVRKQKKEKMK
jgi:hypothetical protein